MTKRTDRGQAAALVIVVVAVLAAATMSAIAALGVDVRDRARAQSAADAVALAWLDGGEAQASRVARANHATIVSWAPGPEPGEITVVVQVASVSARARASDAPSGADST